jgi:hypothetical protein
MPADQNAALSSSSGRVLRHLEQANVLPFLCMGEVIQRLTNARGLTLIPLQ